MQKKNFKKNFKKKIFKKKLKKKIDPVPSWINHYQPILFLLGDYRLLHSLPRVLLLLTSLALNPANMHCLLLTLLGNISCKYALLPILLLTSLGNISWTVNNVRADIGHRQETRYQGIITIASSNTQDNLNTKFCTLADRNTSK